jgi:16S rRNA G966 N2-methylase RsmD
MSTKTKTVSNKQLAIGSNEGQNFCRFWFPNMQDAKWETNDTVSLRSRFMHDVKLKRAIKFCFQHRDDDIGLLYPNKLRTALELVNGGTIQNFKPMNARALYEYICPVFGGDVLDFSSGYGGRMLGAMTSRMRYRYTGIDPNTKTYRGLCALGQLISETINLDGYTMHCMPSEEVQLENNKFDCAFTSPPYFNLETYTDEPTQCMNRYPQRQLWFDGYVVPTLKNVIKTTTNDAIIAVNIADFKTNKIVDDWIEVSKKLGLHHVDTIQMLLNVRPGVGNDRLVRNHKSEGIYIFRK